MRHRDADRAAPNALIVVNEADKEILLRAGPLAVLHHEARDASRRAVASDG
jgi:hypothetical protein